MNVEHPPLEPALSGLLEASPDAAWRMLTMLTRLYELQIEAEKVGLYSLKADMSRVCQSIVTVLTNDKFTVPK